MKHNEISGAIIDHSVKIHKALGPGLLESVYQCILVYELRKAKFDVQAEVSVPVKWDKHEIENGFQADLIVNGLVLVELKSVETIAKVHFKQTLTYLKLTDLKLGLLINFGAPKVKDGIHRLVNGLDC